MTSIAPKTIIYPVGLGEDLNAEENEEEEDDFLDGSGEFEDEVDETPFGVWRGFIYSRLKTIIWVQQYEAWPQP